MRYNHDLTRAALAHFKAERERASANLNVYLKNPAGIGEHPDIIAAVDGQFQMIAEAKEKLQLLGEFK